MIKKITPKITLVLFVVSLGINIALILSCKQVEKMPTQPVAVQKPVESSSVSEKTQLEYINEIRVGRGLKTLVDDPLLDKTAKLKAEDIIAAHYWSHTRPDGSPFYNLIDKYDPGERKLGENLGKCYITRKALVDSWVASPEHLKNIVDPGFAHFGAYFVWDDSQGCFVAVNHFSS